jgi:hypothetical protein
VKQTVVKIFGRFGGPKMVAGGAMQPGADWVKVLRAVGALGDIVAPVRLAGLAAERASGVAAVVHLRINV